MNKTLQVWKWSLGILGRNLLTLLALAALLALWAYGGYQWLWLPESSSLVLLLGLAWAVAQFLVAVAVLAGTATSAYDAASKDATPARVAFMTLDRKLLAQTLLIVLVTTPAVVIIAYSFSWSNAHALEVASFLTFHSGKPLSYHLLEKVFWWFEFLVWIAFSGFLMSYLMIGLRAGWKEAWRQRWRTLARCFFRSSFLTSILTVAVFGSLATLLAVWHPRVSPGFWDYTQLTLRVAIALALIAGGWLFWMLALARLSREM